MQTWFGIPFWIWSVVALAVAAVYWRVWPSPKPGQKRRGAWLAAILRGGHSLVWLLLALACGLFQLEQLEPGILAARAALGVYLVFLGAFVYDRNRG